MPEERTWTDNDKERTMEAIAEAQNTRTIDDLKYQVEELTKINEKLRANLKLQREQLDVHELKIEQDERVLVNMTKIEPE